MKKTIIYSTQVILLFFLLFLGSCGKKRTGCECEREKTASTTVTVWETHPDAEFSTYQYSGELEADAACHAKMYLRFYWADPELGHDPTRPPLEYEFKSLFGWFPTNQDMEKSYFDSDYGKYLWDIEISEAIDKSKPEGSSYGIYVHFNGIGGQGNDAIVCEMLIKYSVYEETAHTVGCD